MAKIKLTKNEQKKQKDSLKMYQRYLPTLVLKKQQLQMEIRNVELKIKKVETQIDEINSQFKSWIGVFGEDVDLDGSLITVSKIVTDRTNIAGVDIPVFRGAEFKDVSYNIFIKPLWVDKAVEKIKEIMLLDLEIRILKEQGDLLGHELRVTTQRVNLFEKVKIPETKSNIKKIAVYLGDQQTASVVQGKIAKKKLVRVS